jgi:hypothetical protein
MPGPQQQTFTDVTPVQTFLNVTPVDQDQESPERLRARIKAAMPDAPDLLVNSILKNPDDPRYRKILAAVPEKQTDNTGVWSGVRSALPSAGDVVKSGAAAAATGGLSLAYDTGKTLYDAARNAPANFRTGAANIRAIEPEATDALGRVNSAVDQAIGGTASAFGPLVGVNPQSMAERASRGDTAGILGEAAVPAALAVGGQAAAEGRAALGERAAWKPGGSKFIGPLPESAENLQAHADLKHAIPATKSTPYTDADLHTAKPFLYDEHRTSPIKSVTDVRDAADAAIGKIEDHVADRIGQIPDDPIATNPRADVQRALSSSPRGQKFVDAGMKELEGLNLDDPTVSEADAIRRQLNAENKAVLKKNNYDIDTARRADAGFAAREAAAESLRNGIYDQLELRGIEGVQGLRQAEGSVIRIRNAAQNQIFNGDKAVRASAPTSVAQSTAAELAKLGGTMAGAHVAGPVGAVVGRNVADIAARAIKPEALTRDALIDRAFQNMDVEPVRYSTINLQALPAKEARPGTQWSMISDEVAPQGGLFDIHQSTPYENFTPQEKANIQAVRERPYQKVLDDPNATLLQKAQAKFELAKMATPQTASAAAASPAPPALRGGPSDFYSLDPEPEPEYEQGPVKTAYRVRSQGDEGISIGEGDHAHATSTLEDAQRLLPGRKAIYGGEPQEIVKIDLSKHKPGIDYHVIPRRGQPAWIRMLRPFSEDEIDPLKE